MNEAIGEREPGLTSGTDRLREHHSSRLWYRQRNVVEYPSRHELPEHYQIRPTSLIAPNAAMAASGESQEAQIRA